MEPFGTRISSSNFTSHNDAKQGGMKKERAYALDSGPDAKFGARPLGGFCAVFAATSPTSRRLPHSHSSFYRLFRLSLRRFYGYGAVRSPRAQLRLHRRCQGPISHPFCKFYATLSDHPARRRPSKTIVGDIKVAAATECGLRSDGRGERRERVRHTQEVTVPSIRGRGGEWTSLASWAACEAAVARRRRERAGGKPYL